MPDFIEITSKNNPNVAEGVLKVSVMEKEQNKVEVPI